jgi:hypothetical protein
MNYFRTQQLQDGKKPGDRRTENKERKKRERKRGKKSEWEIGIEKEKMKHQKKDGDKRKEEVSMRCQTKSDGTAAIRETAFWDCARTPLIVRVV